MTGAPTISFFKRLWHGLTNTKRLKQKIHFHSYIVQSATLLPTQSTIGGVATQRASAKGVERSDIVAVNGSYFTQKCSLQQ